MPIADLTPGETAVLVEALTARAYMDDRLFGACVRDASQHAGCVQRTAKLRGLLRVGANFDGLSVEELLALRTGIDHAVRSLPEHLLGDARRLADELDSKLPGC